MDLLAQKGGDEDAGGVAIEYSSGDDGEQNASREGGHKNGNGHKANNANIDNGEDEDEDMDEY